MEENSNMTAERSLEIITEQIERSRHGGTEVVPGGGYAVGAVGHNVESVGAKSGNQEK